LKLDGGHLNNTKNYILHRQHDDDDDGHKTEPRKERPCREALQQDSFLPSKHHQNPKTTAISPTLITTIGIGIQAWDWTNNDTGKMCCIFPFYQPLERALMKKKKTLNTK
jgi:hypothetical protein